MMTGLAVHRDWHLASWARGLEGSDLLEGLLADARLAPRLMHLAAQGQVLPATADLTPDVRLVLAWFWRVPPPVIFSQLGMLRHAGRWGKSLVGGRPQDIPVWVAMTEIKGALTVLQGLPDAHAVVAATHPQNDDDLMRQGGAMVAGWWAAMDPALMAALSFACAEGLVRDLPQADLPPAICAQAVLALAASHAQSAPQAEGDILSDAVHDGAFDD